MPTAQVRGPSPARVLGMYALSVMEREGPLYGYGLSERVADRTGAAWRPGPGAIYPALQSLVRRGCAQRTRDGRRTLYRITPRGRALLRGVRRSMLWRTRTGPDLGILWSEIAGYRDPGAFMVDRFEAQLARLTDFLAGAPGVDPHVDELRSRVRERLRSAELRLSATSKAPRPPRRRFGRADR